MNIGTTLYVTERKQWRSWLAKHHASASDIWLIFYKKGSGKPRLPYNDAVEEALCYGWIDSIAKSIDGDKYAQRFSPRKPASVLSEMNKERIRRLIRSKKMRRAGLNSIARHRSFLSSLPKPFVFPKDILAAIRSNQTAWKRYQRFPLSYRRIRIGWIDGARKRPAEFKKRLRYFIAMTEKNKQFGMVR